jgi:hypothetical protein
MEGGECGRRRVAGHHMRRAVDVNPAVPHPAVLPREVVEGLREVPGDPRLQQGEQLYLRPVLVPAREVAVLRPLPALDAMRLAVHARIAAVGVADQVRLHERVVERGVEGGALSRTPAAHAYGPQLAIPCPCSRRGHLIDARPRRYLLAEVGLGARPAHVRDPEPHADIVVRAGVEADPAARAAARAVGTRGVSLTASARGGTGGEGAVLPRTRGRERAVERGAEVEPVVALAVVDTAVGAPSAERAGQHPPAHLAPRPVDLDMGVLAAVERVGDPEEQVGGLVGGEREVGHAGPLGNGEVGAGAGVEPHGVAARHGPLVGVREVRGVHGVRGVGRGRRGDVPDERHDRYVARGPRVAARAVHVGEAQPPQPGRVVLVAVGGARAGLVAPGAGRRPGDHAVREGGTRIGVAPVRRADERIDVRGGVGRRVGGAGRGGDRAGQCGGERGGQRESGGSSAEPPRHTCGSEDHVTEPSVRTDSGARLPVGNPGPRNAAERRPPGRGVERQRWQRR